MRLKTIFGLLFFGFFYLSISSRSFATLCSDLEPDCRVETTAECGNCDCCTTCSGPCGISNCTSSRTFTSIRCPDGCLDLRCWDDSYAIPTTGPYYAPGGSSGGDVCREDCYPISAICPEAISCLTERFDQVCDCPNPDDPTPTPTGDPTSGPTGEPTGEPTGTLSFISGNIQEDNGAAFSGSFCTQATNNPLTNNNYNLSVGATSNQLEASGIFETLVSTDTNYTVTLDLSAQTGLLDYICSCPAAIDPDNPHLCRYTDVVPGSTNVNFYLEIANLSNESWFQVFGGNLFGRTGIASIIPYNFCSSTNSCKPALSATNPISNNLLSSGFPIINTGSNTEVSSNDLASITHSYFHLPTRNTNVNSYDVSTDLNQLSYDYFSKLAENSVQTVGDGTSLKPNLSTWTGSAWWVSDDVNYVQVNGNLEIDETQGFDITSGQKLVVFVSGNLTLNDSNPGDTNRKITSVASGGFLAFIANGNVTMTSDIGYALDPLVPTTPTVSNANSNVEGVFIANNDLIIQSETADGGTPPDRKFIGAGTFVGWHDVQLNRTFDDGDMGPILSNSQAIENFIYRPDLLANWPTKLKASTSNWREVDPQYISQ